MISAGWTFPGHTRGHIFFQPTFIRPSIDRRSLLSLYLTPSLPVLRWKSSSLVGSCGSPMMRGCSLRLWSSSRLRKCLKCVPQILFFRGQISDSRSGSPPASRLLWWRSALPSRTSIVVMFIFTPGYRFGWRPLRCNRGPKKAPVHCGYGLEGFVL